VSSGPAAMSLDPRAPRRASTRRSSSSRRQRARTRLESCLESCAREVRELLSKKCNTRAEHRGQSAKHGVALGNRTTHHGSAARLRVHLPSRWAACRRVQRSSPHRRAEHGSSRHGPCDRHEDQRAVFDRYNIGGNRSRTAFNTRAVGGDLDGLRLRGGSPAGASGVSTTHYPTRSAARRLTILSGRLAGNYDPGHDARHQPSSGEGPGDRMRRPRGISRTPEHQCFSKATETRAFSDLPQGPGGDIRNYAFG
jgi:hypothetical protein